MKTYVILVYGRKSENMENAHIVCILDDLEFT